jgi:hypothetical protein
MKIQVRKGKINENREQIISFSEKFLMSGDAALRFKWLYKENSCGEPKVWLAYDETSRNLIGISVAFPRKIFLEGKICSCWVLGDFCIHPSFRSLGPALTLQKTCLRDLESTGKSFIYDFPSNGMMAIYHRMGLSPLGLHVRLIKPLRVESMVNKKVAWRPLAKSAARVGNLALAWREWKFGGRVGEVSLHPDRCGEEFSNLFERAKSFHRLCTVRDADYLNWRYVNNPIQNYDLWTQRENMILRGFMITQTVENRVKIVDLFFERTVDIASRLILEAGKYYRDRGIDFLEFYFLDDHPFIKILEDLGFHKREGCWVMKHKIIDSDSGRQDVEKTNWWLTAGDRDS